MRKVFPYVLNGLALISFIILPYYLFGGKLFVGGDDTRLQYVFPWEYIQHMSFFSWNNISSISYYNPNQFSIPLLLILSTLEHVFKSKVFIDYLAFSAPLVLSFIYLQLMIKEIFSGISYKETFVGALFFVLSPILLQNQLSVFLTPVWLMGLIPILGYYWIRYIKTGKLTYVCIACFWSILLSIALYTIPWILGFILPIFLGSIFLIFFYPKSVLVAFIKKSLVFFFAIISTQLFWLLPFVSTFIGGGNTIGAKVLSSDVANTFRSTVLSTAIGNVFYPLLNLFHRQIIEDFNWQTKGVFENFYDKIALFNILYIALIISPLIFLKNVLKAPLNKLYLFIFCAFLISLYLFTVNVGPFREIFLLGGYIPGFVMFRNFYDKFALGFVFLYALLLSSALYMFHQEYPKLKNILFILVSGLIVLNAFPIKSIVNSPLWTTQSIYRIVTFPQEYLAFLQKAETIISPSTNILSVPLGIAAYTVVKEDNTNNVYAGTSPLKILTGINDYSGDLSFSPDESGYLNQILINKQYNKINQFLQKYNVSYVLVTNNIPREVKESYLFGNGVKLKDQDKNFLSAIESGEVMKSSNGNYVLYKTKETTSIFSIDKGNVVFKKISPVQYELYFDHIPQKTTVTFRDSYHNGWALFLHKTNFNCNGIKERYSTNSEECISSSPLFRLSDLLYSLEKPLFDETHVPTENFGQKWIIDTQSLPRQSSLITKNNDGTVSFAVDLYFRPQIYFYIGSLLSVLSLVFLSAFTIQKIKK